MCVHVGRILNADESVHHIDEDKTNDDIKNLQVLSINEHVNLHNPRLSMVSLTCPHCCESFEVAAPFYNRKTKLGLNIYCSGICSKEGRRRPYGFNRVKLAVGTRTSLRN